MFKHWKRQATVLPALLGLLVSAAVARADWVYREAEGGWKDTETGLVWVDYTLSVQNTLLTFDYAKKMASELVYLGKEDWRLATKAEMLTAVSHGIAGFVPLYGTVPPPDEPWHYYWWSSDEDRNRKSAWAVDMHYGDTKLCGKGGALFAMCVRQGAPERTIAVSKTSVVTSTNGGTDAFTLWLNMQPAAEVTIVVSGDANKATVSPTGITFTQDNWSTPQTVTVTGGSVEGEYAITLVASSDDGAYNGVTRTVAGTNVALVMTTYVSTDVPKKFPKNQGQTNQSTLTVDDSYTVLGLRINISATTSTVQARLVSPSGKSVQVFGPCTVTEEFNGENVKGTWTLVLDYQDYPNVRDQVTAWSIDVWHQ